MSGVPEVEANIKGPDGRRGIALRTPYSESFVDALKAAVPRSDREWREATSSWWIANDHRGLVEQLVLKRWPELMRLGGKDNGAIVTRDGTVAIQQSLL